MRVKGERKGSGGSKVEEKRERFERGGSKGNEERGGEENEMKIKGGKEE